MVEPLRHDISSFSAPEEVSGLFVLGKSNAESNDIPRLPSIEIVEKNDAVGKTTFKLSGDLLGEKYLESTNLYSNHKNGDIVWINSRSNKIRTILSAYSNANTLLLTEQCDNRCLFCSQPPNTKDDAWLYTNAILALLNFDTDTVVGLSGGEPTLNKHSFVTLLESLNKFNNKTPLHILTNGRSLSDRLFATSVWTQTKNKNILWGVPIYGHKSSVHDSLVNSSGAFNDTVRGIRHLFESGEAVEIRIIPTRTNLVYLSNIIDFIGSHYLSQTIVSIMNLEPKGYARNKYQELYVPVKGQVQQLSQCVEKSHKYGLNIRLFNYPLCLLGTELRPYASKTISDWKNYYPEECNTCTLRNECGGFFTSATGKFIENVEAINV